MKKLLSAIYSFLSTCAIFLIDIYQKTLSPDKWILRLWLAGRVCSHTPHCSEYAKQCFQRYNFFTWLHYTIERVTTCIPSQEKQYDPSSVSIVFFSGAPIGEIFLEWLIEDKRYDVVWVITMPDAPRGRWMKVQENSVAMHAKTLWIDSSDIIKPHSLKSRSKKWWHEANACITWLEEKQPDYIVVVAYGKIIPQHILDIPNIAPINVHGSLLPKYRGASPLQSVFLDMQQKTWITIMLMHAELDAGDSIQTLSVPLPFSWTVNNLIDEFERVWPWFLQDTLWEFTKWRLQAVPQDHTQATFTSKLKKEDALVDIYSDSLQDIYAKYRAYAMWPKVYFMVDKKRIGIEKIIVDEHVYVWQKDLPLYISKDGTYELHPSITTLLVKPQGKKSMDWADFVRGYIKQTE